MSRSSILDIRLSKLNLLLLRTMLQKRKRITNRFTSTQPDMLLNEKQRANRRKSPKKLRLLLRVLQPKPTHARKRK